MDLDPRESREGLTRGPRPPVQSVHESVPEWVALRREDLAAVVAKYRQESRRPRQWLGVVTGSSALLSSWLLLVLADGLGWPEAYKPVIFAGSWVVALGSFAAVWQRERQLRTRYQMSCPSCDAHLIDSSMNRGGLARAELAIATGNCPACGARILAE